MCLEFESSSADETMQIGKKIGALLKGGEILAMQGTLAAGKTTMTKGIAASLGIDEEITSPTFCLVSEYEGRLLLHHLDVYRLSGTEDFFDIGAEDFMYSNDVTIIEWSEKIMDVLPKETIVIKIEPLKDSKRKIIIENWQYGQI